MTIISDDGIKRHAESILALHSAPTTTKGGTMTAEDDGPDGMVALGLAVQAGQWPHTMDAMVWADEFCKRFPSISRDDALGWFANAIMAGYDTATHRLSADKARLTAELAAAQAVIEAVGPMLIALKANDADIRNDFWVRVEKLKDALAAHAKNEQGTGEGV